MTAPLLLVDAGNTRTKWATARPGGPVRPVGDLLTAQTTFPRIKAFAHKYPAHQVVLACVVPRLLPAFRRAFGRRLFVVSGDAPELGLKFDYPKPAELGADRLAAAVAAQALGAFPVIIVNCGTATAFTVLNARGALCGGAIAPGLEAQLRALLGATAQLPETKLRTLSHGFLARNTRDAIRSGVLLSFQGGVRETVLRLGQELGAKRLPQVIFTGGNARHLGKTIGGRAEPLLVLEGLRIIGLRLSPSRP